MGGEAGHVTWGKSGEHVSFKLDNEMTVELARFAALDELRDKVQMHEGSGCAPIDGKKLVLLDHLGNQPAPTDLVSASKHLFVFLRPSREMPKEHPDTLPSNYYHKHFVELTRLDVPSLPELSSSLTASQRLAELRAYLHGRTERCKLYSQVARSRAAFCAQSTAALQLQSKARDAVCAHIGQLSGRVSDAYDDLEKKVAAGGKKFDAILLNFDGDLGRLRATPLHPSLQSDGRQHLSDCVHDVTPWKECCHEKWQGLLAKLDEFQQDLHRVKSEVEEVNNALPTGHVDFEHIERAGAGSRETATALRLLQEEAEACLGEVTDSLQRGGSGGGGGGGPANDPALRAALLRQEQQERQHFQALERVEEACQVCAGSRQHIQAFMKLHVEKAVNLTSEIIRLQRRIVTYAAALEGVKEYFRQLEIVRYMPEAYLWGLVEIHRRIHYHRKLACVVGTAQQLLQKCRDDEDAQRQQWCESLGPYLPDGLLDTLQQPVIAVKIDTSPPMADVCYPTFAAPHATPEAIIRYYESLDIPPAPDAPLPPATLISLHSTVMERELDELVSRPFLAPAGAPVPPVPTAKDAPPPPPPPQAAEVAAPAEAASRNSLEARIAAAVSGDIAEKAVQPQQQQQPLAATEPEESSESESEDAAKSEGEQVSPAPMPVLEEAPAVPEPEPKVDEKEAELLRLRARVAALEKELSSDRENVNRVLAGCCQVEECVRSLPNLGNFTIEDETEMAKLAELSSRGVAQWEDLGCLSPDPETWHNRLLIYNLSSTQSSDGGPLYLTQALPVAQAPQAAAAAVGGEDEEEEEEEEEADSPRTASSSSRAAVPAAAVFRLENSASFKLPQPAPAWILVRVVLVDVQGQSITGELVYPRRS